MKNQSYKFIKNKINECIIYAFIYIYSIYTTIIILIYKKQ